jgi:hypothetical protein
MLRILGQPFQALVGGTGGSRGPHLIESRTHVAKGDERPSRTAADSSVAEPRDQ